MATISMSSLLLVLTSLMATCYSQSGFSFENGEYKCEGDESCALVSDAQLVSSLVCKGFCSCCGSAFTFPCLTDKCSIECEEEDSCAGMTITMDQVEEVSCGEPRACAGATFALAAYDGFKFECSDEEACAYSMIFAEMASDSSTAYMDEFQCDGERTCSDAQVVLDRLQKLSCEGYRACGSAAITVYDPAKDFTIQCEGDSSCAESQFYFAFAADAVDLHMKSIECESPQACEDATITIENLSAGTVVIDELKCEGFQACAHLEFAVTGSVEINKCICEQPEPYACLCTSGLDAICNEFEGVWTSSSSIYTCS